MPDMPVDGRRVLIVEDDWFSADDLRIEFERAGMEVVGPVNRVEEALRLLATTGRLDGAVLDINLGGDLVYPVAEALRAAEVPFVFATGYDAGVIPPVYAGVVRCEKPTNPAKVRQALFAPRHARPSG